jgi:hypothetical protein
MMHESIRNGISLFGLAVSITFVPLAGAHFAWIEAEATAPSSAGQSVQVYFGEYSEFLREEQGGRLDAMEGISMNVRHPNQPVSEVALAKEVNRFAGKLAGCLPGRNELVAEQREAPVQDLRSHDMGVVKPMYYARASFICLEDGRVSEQEKGAPAPMDLDIIPLSRGMNLATGRMVHPPGSEVVVKAFFKGQGLPATQLIVHSPIGWDKELHTGADGVATFTPLWPGRYVLELVHVEKVGGEFRGKPYEALRHRSTLSIQVVPDHAGEK